MGRYRESSSFFFISSAASFATASFSVFACKTPRAAWGPPQKARPLPNFHGRSLHQGDRWPAFIHRPAHFAPPCSSVRLTKAVRNAPKGDASHGFFVSRRKILPWRAGLFQLYLRAGFFQLLLDFLGVAARSSCLLSFSAYSTGTCAVWPALLTRLQRKKAETPKRSSLPKPPQNPQRNKTEPVSAVRSVLWRIPAGIRMEKTK